MNKGRLEAFSDSVIAIIITILVLELKVPHGDRVEGLAPLLPTFLNYLLSFVYVGIYWNNHHHLLHTCTAVNGTMLWANLHLLFWLSLLPFATGWLGENHSAVAPTVLYGLVLLCAALAYSLLQSVMIRAPGQCSLLKKVIGRDRKGKLSLTLYGLSILMALLSPRIANVGLVAAVLLWLVPDQRIERFFAQQTKQEKSTARTKRLSQNETMSGPCE